MYSVVRFHISGSFVSHKERDTLECNYIKLLHMASLYDSLCPWIYEFLTIHFLIQYPFFMFTFSSLFHYFCQVHDFYY